MNYRNTLIRQEEIIKTIEITGEEGGYKKDKIILDYLCFVYNFRVAKARWNFSFDIIIRELECIDKSFVDLWQYISNDRDLEYLARNISDPLLDYRFFREQQNLGFETDFNNLFGIEGEILYSFYSRINEERVGKINILDLNYSKPGYSYIFNVILSYLLHKNIMIPVKDSNQILLILPILFSEDINIKYKIDSLKEEISNDFGVRIVENKRIPGYYDIILGEFNAFRIVHEYDLFYFENNLIRLTNPQKLRNLFMVFGNLTKKRYFLGNFLFRLVVSKSRFSEVYDIMGEDKKTSLIPLYILNTQAFLSNIWE